MPAIWSDAVRHQRQQPRHEVERPSVAGAVLVRRHVARCPRSGRRHEGTDLIAQAGRYVYAVTDGTLTRRAWDQPGRIAGNAWWLTASDGSGTYFFYGHLYDFAQGLKVGSRVSAGQIIGFVGDTGSSATAHVHFEIHPNGGEPINPYPTLKSLGGCNTSAPYRQPGGWVPDTGGVATD